MTITDKFEAQPNGDGHTILWNGQVIGKIDFNITSMRWEYSRYSQYPAVTQGNTSDECLQAAQADYAEVHKPKPVQPTVTVVGRVSARRPLYKLAGSTWKTRGPGYGYLIRVKDAQGEFNVIVPESVAAQLRPGQTCELHHDRIEGPYLRLISRPILKRSVAA